MKNKQKLWRKNAANANKSAGKKHQGRKWKYLSYINLGKLDTYPLLTKLMHLGGFNAKKTEAIKIEPTMEDTNPVSI